MSATRHHDDTGHLHHEEERANERGLVKRALLKAIELYGLTAPARMPRCRYLPSCSAYTWQAVKRNGPVLGGWLGAARIMANHRDPNLALCTDGRRLLRVDLPEEGEFWRTSD